MQKYVFEVIESASKVKTKADKIKILRENDSWALRDVLRGTLDKKIEWQLPNTPPPYNKCEEYNAPANLLRKNKMFKYFIKTPNSHQMNQLKRESLFIGLLESIHPKDAELVVAMVSKKPFGGGITSKLVNEAFPNLLSG